MGTPPSTDTATPPPVQLGSLMRRHHLSERLPEVLALTVGLLLSLAVAWAARQWDSEDRGERMREDVAVYAEAIGQQLQSLVAAVQALAQFYTASGAIGAEAFTLFTRPFLERNPAIQALEWVPWVSATRRDSFEAQVRAEGTTDFAIRVQAGADLGPAGARPDYFPVWRVVPLTGNDQALGFNAGSETSRRAALEQARDTGQAVATVPLTLVQGPADQRGILIFVPSTKAGSPAATLEERRRGLQGFAVGVMRLGAMVDGVVAALPPLGLDLVLRDANLPGAAGLLHVHSSRTRAFGMAPDAAALVPGADEQEVRLELAGQPLVLQARPAPGAYPRSAWPLVLMGFGFLISAALFALLRQRRQAAARLREREELFSHFMDRSPTVAWIKDAQGRCVYLSKTFEDRFGVRLGDHQGKTDADVWPPDLAARFLADDQRVLAEDRPLEIDETVPRADGQLRYWQTIKFPFRGADGCRLVGGIGMDVTERKHAELQLRRYQQIVETTEEILLFIDCDRCLQMVNPAFAALYLDTPEVLQGRPLRAVVGEEVYARIAPQLDAALAGERGQFSLQNTFADGRHRYLEVTYSPFWVAAEVQGVVVSVHDITAAEEARAALEAQQTHLEAALREARLARLDALTGIANRAGFDDRLEQAFAQSRRYDRRFGLVLLDLDDFKVINDTRGHQAGDAVLKDVAASLIQSCRAGDLAGRYGGDEFAILLSELPDPAVVVEIARRFSDALAALNWNGRSVSASVGIAIYPDHAGELPELIRLADRAMYASKAAGKNHLTLASALPPEASPADGPDVGG